MGKFSRTLLMIFVLTPLSFLQWLFSFELITLGIWARISPDTFYALFPDASRFGDGESIGVIIGFSAGVVILALVVRAVRRMGWLYFFLEILVSPIRIVLQAISLVICIISLFNDNIEFDPRVDPAGEGDFGASMMRFAFMIRVDSNNSYGYSSHEPFFNEARAYKVKNIFYQLGILLLTLVHSGLLIWCLFGLQWIQSIDLFGVYVEPIIAIIIYILIYLFCTAFSAKLKGVNMILDYYDPETVTKRTDYYRNKDVGVILPFNTKERIGSKTEVVKEAGWRFVPRLGMIIYMIASPLVFIPQLITLLIAIFVPANAPLCPCRAKDADIEEEDNFSGKKLLHIFTGLSHDYEIEK